MIYLPPLRRLLIPVVLAASLIILYRSFSSNANIPSFIFHQPPAQTADARIPVSELIHVLPLVTNTSKDYSSPPEQYYYTYAPVDKGSPNQTGSVLSLSTLNPDLAPLFRCPIKANNHTGHIRISNIVQNISQIPPDSLLPEKRVFWNPTVIALPHWSKNQYLVVSRIVTDGNHQENVLCEANVCYIPGQEPRVGEHLCTEEDLMHVGPGGGMRCASPPVTLSVPPTPAERCEGKFAAYTDIPGFHDPRIFWSGKGEPLMMVNTQ